MVPHGDGIHFLEEAALEFSVIWKLGEDLQNPNDQLVQWTYESQGRGQLEGNLFNGEQSKSANFH